MIIRTTTGRSFKGVGAYVLHDKGAQSNDRVSFTETVNLASSRENVALAEMIHTATHQKELKRRAGHRATATSKPVYHMSLSWEVSETPTLAEQMDAAKEAIKSLGLSDRQAMIVGHTDTDNPHVHVVVNLVCPETGMTAKMGNDRLKLSEWAQEYRRKRGQEHLCQQRQVNNARRKQGEFVKAQNMTRAEYNAWKKAEGAKIWDEYRADRDQAFKSRKGQYDALWDQKNNRMAARKAEIKQLYKPYWRDLYKAQRQELKEFDNHLVARLKFALHESKQGKVAGLFQALTKDQKQRKELTDHHEDVRRGLADRVKSSIADAGREVTKAWKYDRDQLKTQHNQDDQARLERTREKSDALKQGDYKTSRYEFERNQDRRKKANKLKRDTTDAFGTERTAGNDDATEDNKRNRTSAEIRAEKRARSKGRTRTRSRRIPRE